MPREWLDSFGAPTRSADPFCVNATCHPKSCVWLLDALMYACGVQGVPLWTNTSAAPAMPTELSSPGGSIPVAALDSHGAPTATVAPSPASAMLAPNRSCAPALDAMSRACCVQV